MNSLSELEIKKLRARSKTALTRLRNDFNAQLSLTELKTRLEKIELTFKEFDQYDAALPEKDWEIAEFETEYFETKVIYISAIEELNRTVLNVGSTLVGANFKLPRLSIPTFNGKFIVRLPIFNKAEDLGDSKPLAIPRLISMERKFNFNEELSRQSKDFMQEYETLNHMVPVDSAENDQIYYLPHHAVIKSSSTTTKLRVVFDGSCKPKNSVSLNSVLGVGTTLQRDIFSILLNFRVHKIAFSADIEKMYRQILVDDEDQNLQRIVWRNTVNSKMQSYKLCTVTYGTASSPFLATRCLWQIALDAEQIHPHISSIIKNDFYVDDCLSGSNNLEEAADICSKLSQLLSERGFHLRKWRSNCSKLLEDLSIEFREASDLEIHSDDCAKTLGLLWNSTEDIFLFNISMNFGTDITKRKFISQSSKIFDPLGLLSPCTVKLKVFYQRLWLLKLDWDSPLPKEWMEKLLRFQEELKTLSGLKISRWLQTTTKSIRLRGFCDTSECAYAAVIHCVQPISPESTKVNLLVTKTKVAPVKQVSLPILELLFALLLIIIFKAVSDVFSSYDISFHAWTDSKVVLNWFADHPRRWKLFVANRTSEIRDTIPYQQWSYIPSKENPADIPSRGSDPKLLPNSSLWWHGSSFLTLRSSDWPLQSSINNETDNDATVLVEQTTKSIFSSTVQLSNDTVDNLFKNCSSLSKIVNVLYFCLRFISRCKRISGADQKVLQNSSFVPPSSRERQAAMKLIIKWICMLSE